MTWPCANTSSVSGKDPIPPGYTHMTFFWGKNSEILFPSWPGTCTPIYFFALVLVFGLGVLNEWFKAGQTVWFEKGEGWCPNSIVLAGVLKTAVHSLRKSVLYLLLLSVMSFNGGVFIMAVLGHAVGFLFFSSGIFNWQLLKKIAAAAGYI